MTPRSIPVGNGSLLITTEAFMSGFQAGHLSYMAEARTVQHTDESITTLFLEKLESTQYSSLYSMGFVVGWLATLAKKGGQP